tara:strand:+ start:4338 stop:4709 length:372 start_codon:yes stop_codon:yes gene_type:complete
MDTEYIIKNIINEYVNPEYPIYRVKYVLTEMLHTNHEDIDMDDPEFMEPFVLNTEIATRLMECKKIEDVQNRNAYHYNKYISLAKAGHYITPELVRIFNQNNHFNDCYSNYEHITVVELERVA